MNRPDQLLMSEVCFNIIPTYLIIQNFMSDNGGFPIP